jgi:hypothetical protein
MNIKKKHCDFNRIELIWGYIKGFVSRQNSTFKQNDVKELIHKVFAQVNELKWQKSCNHVKNVVEPKFWKEDGIREETPKFIININSDSESESGNDESESDGDETEEYE